MLSSDGHLSITHTAAGFPENGLFVNASTIYCFILSSRVSPFLHYFILPRQTTPHLMKKQFSTFLFLWMPDGMRLSMDRKLRSYISAEWWQSVYLPVSMT